MKGKERERKEDERKGEEKDGIKTNRTLETGEKDEGKEREKWKGKRN